MADIHGSPGDAPQMPQASDSGPAPVPYGGPGQSPEPPLYDAGMTLAVNDFSAPVMSGIPSMPGLTESATAHDINAGLVTPYYAGDISPVDAAGDPDAGGCDDVSGTVQGSVDAATARFHEHESDLGAGGTIGDLMTFPPGPLDPGAGVGNVMPTGGFYDPPRSYE